MGRLFPQFQQGTFQPLFCRLRGLITSLGQEAVVSRQLRQRQVVLGLA
ncbi:hypothetical protein SynA1840_00485 [Synechococcus sp. A18-40]|nr:hypothetical protein SynA1840_00485 [Synechococcus sp. A18-40]